MQMDANPKVSIIIPVYNGANYLRDAIDSALAQTYKNIEIIVVNDGSNDSGETEHIAISYGDRIRYFKKENGGVATALNYGIEQMTGDYFSWLSHDDMYAPEKIECELSAIIASGDPKTIAAEGRQIVNAEGAYLRTDNIHSLYSESDLKKALFVIMRLGITGCGILIHKSHFDRAGLFDPKLPMTQDYDLWFRILRGQKLVFLNSNNVLSRSHEKQDSRLKRERYLIECDKLWIGIDHALTDDERMEISDSKYLFYKDWLACLCSRTNYQGAICYARACMLRAALEEYEASGCAEALNAFCGESGLFTAAVKAELLPLRASKNERTRILLYWDNAGEQAGADAVPRLSELLSRQYDIVAVSPAGDGISSLPEGVRVLHIPLSSTEACRELLPTLATCVKADLVINACNCSGKLLNIYSAAKSLGFHSIAWNNEDFFYPFKKRELQGYLNRRIAMLGQADACVWRDQRSAWTYSRLAENGALQGVEFEAFWTDMVSAVLTMSDESRRAYFSEKYQNELSICAEFLSRDTVREYESCVFLLQQQNADAEKKLAATEKKLAKQIAEYRAISESHSWRLTKPLRQFVHLFRIHGFNSRFLHK